MRLLLLFCVLMFLQNCSKPKTVLICGDHICVNKAEAKQYFEDNLSIEVKITNKKENKQIDLVELNLKDGIDEDRKKVILVSKNTTKRKIKKLSNNEIQRIKSDIKNKKKKKKVEKKIASKLTNKNINKTNAYKQIDQFDVCTILPKCSIDEISKYLIKQGKKKDFPKL